MRVYVDSGNQVYINNEKYPCILREDIDQSPVNLFLVNNVFTQELVETIETIRENKGHISNTKGTIYFKNKEDAENFKDLFNETYMNNLTGGN